MAITKDQKLADLIRSLIFHGRDNSYLKIDDDDVFDKEVIDARFRFNYPGYSSRLTEMEAALGLVELENWPSMMNKRQENARYLCDKLNRLFDPNHAYMMFPFFHLRRNDLMYVLELNGVGTTTIMPLIHQPYIKNTINQRDYPQAMYVNEHGLLFGCHQDLTTEDLDHIINIIGRLK